jgi:hypothetical protein
MTSLNPARDYIPPPAAYIQGLRSRLGLPIISFPGQAPCGACGNLLYDFQVMQHAASCAKGARTSRHNLIRDLLSNLAYVADNRVRIEVTASHHYAPADSSPSSIDGLVPADILLSSASFGGSGLSAIDVGVTGPVTAATTRDPTIDPLAIYAAAKVAKNSVACALAGWDYCPFIISSQGRATPRALSIVRDICKAAARRVNADAPRMEAGFWRRCSAILLQHNHDMLIACRPSTLSARSHRVMSGGINEDLHGQQPPWAASSDDAGAAATANPVVSGHA